MRLRKRRATILLCSVAAVAFSTAAVARPVHKAAHRHHAEKAAVTAHAGAKHYRRHASRTRHRARQQAVAISEPAAAEGFSSAALSANALVSEARKYLGTNPTGWKNARYDALVSKISAAPSGSARRKLIAAAEKILVEEEAIVIPVFYPVVSHLVSERVEGFAMDPLNGIPFAEITLRR